MRLGCVIPELQALLAAARPCWCGAALDVYGFHPGLCRAGNRSALWATRHDAVQTMLVHLLRSMRLSAVVCSSGAGGGWFGPAGFRAGSSRARAADVVMPHALGPGRHRFLDVAVTSPDTGAALAARPSSAVTCGVAAEQRAARKQQKYGPLAAGVGGVFVPVVLERFGAMCDRLVGLLLLLCGDRERDAARCEDYTSFARSRITYVAGLLGLATAAADAAMLEHAIALTGVPRATARAGGWTGIPDRLAQRDVEGVGGQAWYEGPRDGLCV